MIVLVLSSSTLHCMQVTAKITKENESYSRNEERFVSIARLDKKKGTYSAVRYWDADCITEEPNPEAVFNMLKSAYRAQQQQNARA